MSKNPHAVALGRRGGKVGGKATSPAKKKSGSANMAKAREKRWPDKALRGINQLAKPLKEIRNA